MTINTGAFSIDQLLATNFQSVAEFGRDNIQAVLAADITAHNAIYTDMVNGICEVTQDLQRVYGASQNGEMVEVDEFGRIQTQKPNLGADVAFPMKKLMYAVGWTRDWMMQNTPADMAMKVDGAKKAHLVAMQNAIRDAIFIPTNRTVIDRHVANVSLGVKAFLNADGDPIPDGPNGETFDGATHTHYLANAGLTNQEVVDLIETVVEHGHGQGVVLAIARGNETAVRALTDFEPYVDARLVTQEGTPMQRLDNSRIDNRAIGIFQSAEVWVKSWVPTGYMTCYAEGDSANKPLCFREHTVFSGLRIAGTIESEPLTAEYMDAYFGVGAYTRTAAACLDFVNASYTSPF